MNDTGLAVAVYDSHLQAEDVVRELADIGFDMKATSIVDKDDHSEKHVVGYFNAGDRAKLFGKLGAYRGRLAGVLFGSALMFVPVVGRIIAPGPLVAALVRGLEGAMVGGGLTASVGVLSAIGIPKDSVLRYQTALKAEKFLVIVHGDADQIKRAPSVGRSR